MARKRVNIVMNFLMINSESNVVRSIAGDTDWGNQNLHRLKIFFKSDVEA